MNKALLRKVALKLRRLRHEKHYDQRTWGDLTDCGTTCCIAGFAVQVAGHKLVVDKESWDGATLKLKDSRRSIEDVAREELKLTRSEARTIFYDDPVDKWPREYGERFERARCDESKERPSRVAAEFLLAVADGKVKL